jgi:hypothetical protein
MLWRGEYAKVFWCPFEPNGLLPADGFKDTISLKSAGWKRRVRFVGSGEASMIPRIAVAFGGVQTSTFRQALQDGLATEGVGLDKVIGFVRSAYQPNDHQVARFLQLYEFAYDGMNDRAIWGGVIAEIVYEVRSPGRLLSSLPKGFQFTPETQAIWRLVERKISPTPAVIRPRDDFGGGRFPFFSETFLDLGVSSSEHGWVSHMIQDLVVNEALRRARESIRVADFRSMLWTIG